MNRDELIKIVWDADVDCEGEDAPPFPERILDALLAHIDASGWKLVPIDPTEEMRLCGMHMLPVLERHRTSSVYRAMVKAAPKIGDK